MIFMFSNPFAEIIVSDSLFLIFKYNRIESTVDTGIQPIDVWPVTFLLISILAINFVNIFLYRNRILQMRLCVFNIILLFGLVGMIYFLAKITLHQNQGQESVFLWPIMIPFISIVLTYLAFKGIQKDEKLVRSYDRIR